MQLTGGEIIWECLVREGVEVVFGYPGGATLPTYDALNSYPQVYHVLTRHEQAAAHAADGYARACGKVGVAMATSGPGATNLVTGIATAMLDSSPIVCITGQVPTSVIGTDAFQETDMTGITLPITKHNYLVTRVEDLAQTIREAFHVARTGRPGPVLVDVPKDVQIAETEFAYPEDPFRLPGYRPKDSESLSREIQEAVELINDAQRPLVLAGHGVLMSNATKELITFAEKGNVPVALTLLGIGGWACTAKPLPTRPSRRPISSWPSGCASTTGSQATSEPTEPMPARSTWTLTHRNSTRSSRWIWPLSATCARYWRR